MSEAKQQEKRKKFSFGKFTTHNKKFLVLMIFFLLSVMTIVFTTKDLFDTSADDWIITQGSFEGVQGSFKAKTSTLNWAHHASEVAYGEWFWSYRYFGSGSASVIFIGSDHNTNDYFHSTIGYKLEMEIQKPLSLIRLDGLGIETVLTSTFYLFQAQQTYNIKIIRSLDNNFTISINDEFKLSAVDDTYSASDVFELDWFNRHTLTKVIVTDHYNLASWEESFTGLPTASSTNIYTQIALYLPFIALSLVVIFYIFRLLFTEGNWVKFLVPLIIAIIIGVSLGLLFDYLRTLISVDELPTGTMTPPTETHNTNNITIISPSTNPQNNTNGGDIPTNPINQNPISLILLIISGIFILLMVSFVLIDFFKKRENEFHEKIISKDVRWLPKTTEQDHRKRVIRAYHKASYDLIDHGASSEKSMTPVEFHLSALSPGIPLCIFRT